jgi:ribosomal protein S27E
LSNSTTITATQLIAAEAMPQLWMYPPEGDEDHGKEEDYSNSTSYATTGGYTPYTPKCTTTLSNATTSTSPTNNSNKPSNTSKGGGGSKDGRIKCPKCGQHVLFQHADFEENTFYCATCSSWFLVAPSSDSSKITNTTPLDYQQQQQRSSNSNGSSVGNVSLSLFLSSLFSILPQSNWFIVIRQRHFKPFPFVPLSLFHHLHPKSKLGERKLSIGT